MQASTELDLATNDLGPLAWVLDELRKSLDSASAALRRFVRDTALARGSDMASVDGGHLRIARQQLHQAVGALEMVGLGATASMLRGMEAAVQKFVERPELCNEASAAKVERAGFALTEYLEGVLLGKSSSAVALFPQYREVQELSGADRIHPADLWAIEWRWNEVQVPAVAEAMVYDQAVRSRLDQGVLKLVKSGDQQAAMELSKISLSLSATQSARQPKIFWQICSGFFEGMALGLLPLDIYVKRAGSRILLQYASLAKGDLGVSDRLAQDLVFFCSQAVPPRAGDAPLLEAVRAAWSLGRFKPVDYQTPQYGRFDPVLLSQARKRIGTAKETWSSLSGGDTNKLKGLVDQFHLVSDSLVKLHPASAPLAQSLTNVIDTIARTARPPGPEVAMEVATAVLYLEAAFEDLDPADTQLASRTARLADRLERVRSGSQPEALEPWMEELYRRVSDRQTMGSVVSELRGTLSELEKLLDQFFRNLQDKSPLRDAPSHLSQMRGVLSVLGLDQAAQAVLRMRESVEEIMVTEIDEERARAAGTFDKLGNNLGALGFLIDMLNYQPSLAKKLFVYDDATGELRPLMGRVGHEHSQEAESSVGLQQEVGAVTSGHAQLESPEVLSTRLDSLAAHAVLADQPALAQSAREAASALSAHDADAAAAALDHLAAAVKPVPVVAAPTQPELDVEEDDLRDIFLEEAREVVENGLAAITALAAHPSDVAELTTLRRAFHTLKGSSRMVGLTEFGEAAWSMEQVLNTWLADQKPATDELRALSGEAMRGFSRWVDDIAGDRDGAWKASMFRVSADAMRTDRKFVPLTLPQSQIAESPEVPQVAALPDVPDAADISLADSPSIDVEVVELDFLADEPLLAETTQPSADEVAAVEAPQAQAPEIVAARGKPDEQLTDAMAFDLGAFEMPGVELPSVELDSVDFSSPEPIKEPAVASLEAPAVQFDPEHATVSFDATQVIRSQPIAVTEISAEEAADFDFDIDAPSSEPAPEAASAPVEIEGIDFGSLSAVSGDASIDFSQPAAAGLQVSESDAPDELAEFAASEEATDEQIKVIGSLRIGIPLYNVYLNEADEWSRRLATEVSEWALEMNQPVQDSTVGLAHALAGSSATVGFEALSDIARALETALSQTQSLSHATPQHGKAFTDAAEEIRRLLHQFAAGFLKEPDHSVTEALHALRDLDVPAIESDSVEDPFSEFAEIEAIEAAPPVVEVQPEPESAADAEPTEDRRTDAQPAPLSTLAAPQAITRLRAADADADEDEIDVADAIDPDLFPIFEEEAVELMPQLGGAMRQWAARPDNRSARDEVLRALHTIKGSARLAGALRLGELAHRMESEVESLGSENFAAADLEALLHRVDLMQGNFDRLRAAGAVEAVEAPIAVPDSPSAPVEPAKAEVPAAQRSLVARPVPTQIVAPRAPASHAVRVRSQLLDRLVNQAGEVMITRSRLEAELRQLRGSLGDLTGNLDRLRSQLRDIELQAESQMQSRLAQAKDSAAGFDPLEFDRFTRVQELTRMMAESVNDVATVQRNLQRTVELTEDDLIAQARQTRELQRDLLRTRMVEFEGISDRLYRVIRLASKETGKQVKLDITGGSIEMDRGVLDRMTPAFEHLLRNCVAHGIEDPHVRTRAGKDPAGTILIELRQEGNDVSVAFRDDGAGLDIGRIREKALQQGLVTANSALSDEDAANLIFMPGFSTAKEVTELAGRGIGMDVVRAEVNALGGRIETTTQAGQGTSFRLVLPLTTAVTQVVMIRAGNLSFGVPANLVEIVRRAPARDVQQAYNSGNYEFAGEEIPFFWCGALLQSSARSGEPQGKTLPVVVFRSAAQRVAVHVDEVLGNQEVVVKNLGPQLARLPGLAGMTVLASGAVVLIYNPVALTTVYGEQARLLSADKAQPEVLEVSQGATKEVPVAGASRIPLILVVDDSITVRRVTQRLLQREGYRVALAADGLQALERLAEEKPVVVLSDIEMPRMDGFDLARNIRGDARLKDLPIIMITSRIAEKHREHARELGVDHYLGKPYSEEELLSLVKHHCETALTV